MSAKKEIEQLIAAHTDDRELAIALDAYSRNTWEIADQVSWWGPALYERNRQVFLPLIERYANQWSLRGTKNLEAWKDEADSNGDIPLFRILLSTWLNEKFGWGDGRKKWRQFFEEAYRAAPDRGARRIVVQKYNLWYDIDDDFTAELYRVDPVVAREFLIGRLEREQWIDATYETTAERAREAGDDELYFFLYRWTFPAAQWQKDVRRLASEVSDPKTLCAELAKRQPDSPDGLSGDPETYAKLLEQRGADVLPYLERYIGDVVAWNDTGWDKFARAAYDRGFLKLWALIVRTKFRHPAYPAEVIRIVDSQLRDTSKIALLGQIAGAKWGWREWRRHVPLEESTMLQLYAAFPEVARIAFAPHILLTTQQPYQKLAETAHAAGDTAMVDHLTARAAIAHSGWYYRQDELAKLSWYAELLEGLGEEFTARAVNILNQIDEPPKFGRRDRQRVHPVYKILFDPERYGRDVLRYVGDLLEAPCSDVRHLGLRLIRRFGDADTAVRHIDHLSAYLLNESGRNARIEAFAGLAIAAEHSRAIADDVLARAREALDLRRKSYPRDRLIELIGRILYRWPELRTPAEIPVVFGDAPAQEASW